MPRAFICWVNINFGPCSCRGTDGMGVPHFRTENACDSTSQDVSACETIKLFGGFVSAPVFARLVSKDSWNTPLWATRTTPAVTTSISNSDQFVAMSSTSPKLFINNEWREAGWVHLAYCRGGVACGVCASRGCRLVSCAVALCNALS